MLAWPRHNEGWRQGECRCGGPENCKTHCKTRATTTTWSRRQGSQQARRALLHQMSRPEVGTGRRADQAALNVKMAMRTHTQTVPEKELPDTPYMNDSQNVCVIGVTLKKV